MLIIITMGFKFYRSVYQIVENPIVKDCINQFFVCFSENI